MADANISVTVVYAPAPRRVLVVGVQLPVGATLEQALLQSGVLQDEPRARVQQLELGLWGRKAPAGTPLQDGDRVEVYRPLIVDPKMARRVRFAKQGARTAGLFAQRRPGAKPGY